MRVNVKPINILFRNDDPCALSNPDHERRYLDIFAKHGIPQVVSVIPFMSEDPHNSSGRKFHELSENKEIVELLRESSAKGLVEIAQHGTTHQTNHLHPSSPVAAIGTSCPGLGFPWLRYAPMYPERGYSEFNGLEKDLVRKELKRGKDHLSKIFQKSIDAFTFPWGTLDKNALTAVKEVGFKTAFCGGRNISAVKGLTTIYNAREDIFRFAQEITNGQLSGPVFYHVVLHSWMLKDHEFLELDKLLSGLAADKRVGFVTLKDLAQWPARFHVARAADHKVRVWGEMANRHLGTPMRFPQRYDLDFKKYIKGLLKSGLVTLIFEKIGLVRFWIFSGLLFLAVVLVSIFRQESFSLLNLTALAGTGCLFVVLCAYKFKTRFSAGDLGIPKEDCQNYQEVSVKAFSDPQNKSLVNAFFRLFEQAPASHSEDREKYLQLKYFHAKEPWVALNELAQGYAQRGLNSLSYMCCAESLLRNPKQEDVFQLIQKCRNRITVKKLEPSDDACAISVIVCTNRVPLELKTCLKSILAQTFQDFEIIVLNNNGPLEIQQVAQSFADPRIVYKRIDADIGVSKFRNVAIQLAKGKYVAYLDDDDVFYPDHLETLYNVAREGKCRFVFAKTRGVLGYLQGGEFVEIKEVFHWGREFDLERFASRASIGNHAVLHERNIFFDLGLFNDELIIAEEEDFYLRCAAAFGLKHVNKNTSEYRIKDNNSVVVNAARNHFHGAIVRRFHAAFRGELARLKYLVNARDKKGAQETLDTVRAQYRRGYFKSAFVLKELLPLLKFCGDRDFFRMVAADFDRLYVTGAHRGPINKKQEALV